MVVWPQVFSDFWKIGFLVMGDLLKLLLQGGVCGPAMEFDFG